MKYAARFGIGIIIFFNCALSFAQQPSFDDGKADFKLKFKDIISPYRIMFTSIMPDEILECEMVDSSSSEKYVAESTKGQLVISGVNKWTWEPPKRSGKYEIIFRNAARSDSILLNVFVLVPLNQIKRGKLNGFRIGEYPRVPLRNLSVYKAPNGAIEVIEENSDLKISPHFTLKNFLCKQQCAFPKYLVLQERLLLKLELILEKVNEKGYRYDSIHIMSGYRTPHYNKMIGNVKYSRHVYGGAADIFLDEHPKDGMMDDLNKDGRINYLDANVLYDIIEEMYGKPWYKSFIGGLGWYGKTSNHGPFVHIDVRQIRARWGD